MKRLEMDIESCEKCPFSRFGLLNDFCSYVSDPHTIDDISEIPEDCPLPDAEDKEDDG